MGVQARLCALFCVLIYFGFRSTAQSPEPPISQATCNALKDIAGGTNGSLAPCTVQEGCGSLVCTNALFGSSVLTLQPCTDPTSIMSRFYDTSDNLVHEQNLSSNATVMFGSASLIFSITQLPSGIGIKVDLLPSFSADPYIQYTEIPINKSLCINASSIVISPTSSDPVTTSTSSVTSNSPVTHTTGTVTMSPTMPGNGYKIAATTGIILGCIWIHVVLSFVT